MKGIIENNTMVFTEGSEETAVTIFFDDSTEGVWDITSVVADPNRRGEGLSTRAMEIFLSEAVKESKKLKPTCSFAKHWLDSNPEKKDNFVSA